MPPNGKELNVEVDSEELVRIQGPIRRSIDDERSSRPFTPGIGRSQFDTTPPRPLGAPDGQVIFEG